MRYAANESAQRFVGASKETIVTLSGSAIDRVEVSTFTIPTDFPESDGTLEWNSTTLVLVHAYGGGRVGLGYTYADTATATLIRDLLSKVVKGRDAMSPAAHWVLTLTGWPSRLSSKRGTPAVLRAGITAMSSKIVGLCLTPGDSPR